MTRDAITDKLGAHLNKPPVDEKDVVYAMVKIRKVLEHDKQRKRYWALTFYCDWVLHTKLSQFGAMKIINMLDERFAGFRTTEPKKFDPDGKIQEILSFQLFREELLVFLSRNRLPTVWAEDQFAWDKMIMLYGEEVRDTPLVVTNQVYNFKYLREIVISACEPSEAIVKANPKDKHFGFRWQFKLKDGRSFPMVHTSNLPEPPPNWQTQGKR